MEPLTREFYSGPEKRLYTLKKYFGTENQTDGSKYRRVSLDDVDYYLLNHRRFDVPTFNDYSLQDFKGYILDGGEIYQYKVCWVKESLRLGEDEWLYVGEVSRRKGTTYRLVREYGMNGLITSEYFKTVDGHPKRRYVRNDYRLKFWVSRYKDILLPRLEIVKELLDSVETIEELYAAVENYERDKGLVIRGIKRLVEPHNIGDYFSKYMNRPPLSIWKWRMNIDIYLENERRRQGLF